MKNVSKNAYEAYLQNNINELVADTVVLDDKIQDKELLNKVKGVLKWK